MAQVRITSVIRRPDDVVVIRGDVDGRGYIASMSWPDLRDLPNAGARRRAAAQALAAIDASKMGADLPTLTGTETI